MNELKQIPCKMSLLERTIKIYQHYFNICCFKSSMMVYYTLKYDTPKFQFYDGFFKVNSKYCYEKKEVLEDIMKNPYTCVGVCFQLSNMRKDRNIDFLYHQFIIVNEEKRLHMCSTYNSNNKVYVKEITMESLVKFLESEDVGKWNEFFDVSENLEGNTIKDITIVTRKFNDKIVFPVPEFFCDEELVFDNQDDLISYLQRKNLGGTQFIHD